MAENDAGEEGIVIYADFPVNGLANENYSGTVMGNQSECINESDEQQDQRE